MPANVKQESTPDAATLELWRVAETDDVEALRRILPRVADINARNKHGVTALMRAACHGNERIVRALLDRGADPNLARNDKFTALTLAAFFGHTEAVKTLMDRGARTEIVTRCGTSAHMWARARTFVEVARCLESQTPAPTPARTVPAPPLVVKTLKEPPEIWDLVQEAPRNFNARSAFLSRLKSMNSSFALRVAAVLLVSAVAVVGAMLFKNSQAHNLEPDAIPPVSQKSTTESTVIAPASVEKASSEPVVETSETGVVRNHGIRKNMLPRQVRPRASAAEDVMAEDGRSKEAPAPPVIATPQIETRSSTKANTALSPQVIAPAKSAPPKAKVIQWP
jgi:hypothetical protein